MYNNTIQTSFKQMLKICLVSIVFSLNACNNGSNSSTQADNNPTEVAKVPLVKTNSTQLMASVDNITNFPVQLESHLWTGMVLNPEVKHKAISTADELIHQLNESGLVVTDIVTLGSMASYEYDSYADFDIHIFIDASNYAGDVAVLKKYIAQFNLVNRNKYKVNYYNYPVEFMIYVAEPSSQIQAGVGMYSLKTDTWLSPPTQNLNNFNKDQIYSDANDYINQYNQLATQFNNDPIHFECTSFASLMSNMRNYRSDGINQDGIRSTANLTYRMLRRLNINLPDSLREANDECISTHASLF